MLRGHRFGCGSDAQVPGRSRILATAPFAVHQNSKNSRPQEGKWTNSRSSDSRRRTDAVPMALYTKVEQARKQGAHLITDSQISESSSDLFQEAEASTDQELRLGVAGKAISPSKILRVGVDVDEGANLLHFLSSHKFAIRHPRVLIFYFGLHESSLYLLDFGKLDWSKSWFIIILRNVLAVLGNFLASLNTFIAEEYLLQHNASEYYVYDFMKVSICHFHSSDQSGWFIRIVQLASYFLLLNMDQPNSN
jgi:hypothetical protein